jgi:hypothetical protein
VQVWQSLSVPQMRLVPQPLAHDPFSWPEAGVLSDELWQPEKIKLNTSKTNRVWLTFFPFLSAS